MQAPDTPKVPTAVLDDVPNIKPLFSAPKMNT
jgi:hypothetical protein